MQSTLENLQQQLTALAQSVDTRLKLLESSGPSSVSFPAFSQAMAEDENSTVEQLRAALTNLKDQGRLKPRDAHEVAVLVEIFDERSPARRDRLIQARLSQLYVAADRGWREAQSWTRRPLDQKLGLPDRPIINIPRTARSDGRARAGKTKK